MNNFSKELTPKNDIVFKRIFGTKGNEGILKDFLEAILDIEIEYLELDLNTELLPDFLDGKKSRVDVRTRLSDGTEVNIEMQVDTAKYNDKRCLQHWSKIYNNTIKKGEDYSKLRKTICIWILDGEIYKEFEDIDSKWQIANLKYGLDTYFKDKNFCNKKILLIIFYPKIIKINFKFILCHKTCISQKSVFSLPFFYASIVKHL